MDAVLVGHLKNKICPRPLTGINGTVQHPNVIMEINFRFRGTHFEMKIFEVRRSSAPYSISTNNVSCSLPYPDASV